MHRPDRNPLTYALRGCGMVAYSIFMLPFALVFLFLIAAMRRDVADDEEAGS